MLSQIIAVHIPTFYFIRKYLIFWSHISPVSQFSSFRVFELNFDKFLIFKMRATYPAKFIGR